MLKNMPAVSKTQTWKATAVAAGLSLAILSGGADANAATGEIPYAGSMTH